MRVETEPVFYLSGRTDYNVILRLNRGEAQGIAHGYTWYIDSLKKELARVINEERFRK